MSREYRTYFSPTSRFIDRWDMYKALEPIFAAAGLRFSGECMRLACGATAGDFDYDYCESNYVDVEDALHRTTAWPGVLLEFDTPFGDRTLFFTRTPYGDHQQQFGFDDTSALFSELSSGEKLWFEFEEFVVDVLEVCHAEFAVATIGDAYTFLSQDRFLTLLHTIPDDPLKAKPPLLVLRADCEPAFQIPRVLDSAYDMRQSGVYEVFRDRSIFLD